MADGKGFIGFCVVILALGTGMMELSQSQEPAIPDEAILAPTHEAGEFWRFRARGKEVTANRSNSIFGAYEIVYIGNEYKLFRRRAGTNSEISEFYNPSQLDLEPTPSELVAFVDFQRVWQYIQFPLFVGQRWHTSYKAYSTIGSRFTRLSIDAEGQVVGTEEVSTQGGTFQTLKIERYAVVTGTVESFPILQDVSYVYFYAPTTGSIVNYNRKGGGSNVRVELLKFGRRSK
jgi:hypothetical protein